MIGMMTEIAGEYSGSPLNLLVTWTLSGCVAVCECVLSRPRKRTHRYVLLSVLPDEIGESLPESVFTEFQIVRVTTVLIVAIDSALHLEPEMFIESECPFICRPGVTGDRSMIVRNLGYESLPVASTPASWGHREKENVSVSPDRGEGNERVVFDEELAFGSPICVGKEPASLLQNVVLPSNPLFQFPRIRDVTGVPWWVNQCLSRDAHWLIQWAP